MSERIIAVFENGVFRPETPVHVADGERVTLSIDTPGNVPDDLADIADLLDTEVMQVKRRSEPAPTLEEVRQITSKFKGSLADSIVEDREDRI